MTPCSRRARSFSSSCSSVLGSSLVTIRAVLPPGPRLSRWSHPVPFWGPRPGAPCYGSLDSMDDELWGPPSTAKAAPRPLSSGLRIWYAYWVTIVVVLSYLSLGVQARFRSPATIERLLGDKHLRNAR